MSIAIRKQVYAAPYLAVCTRLLLREEPVTAVHAISLTPRPMTVVFGFRTSSRFKVQGSSIKPYKGHDSTCTTHAGKVTYKHDT